jgi:phosphoglycolate phosphatase
MIKVLVFDFDGTLVDSNNIKYEAYFKLFPADDPYKSIIKEVLRTDFEKSRFFIINKICQIINETLFNNSNKFDQNELFQEYSDYVLDGVKKCPEITGATNLLKFLKDKYRLYLSSTTPETFLREILTYRDIQKYFVEIYGYPKVKNAVLKEIMEKESIDNSKALLVVGDGKTDEESAKFNFANYLKVEPSINLEKEVKKFLHLYNKSC